MILSVLEHVSDPGRVLAEARRIVAPAGPLLVATPFAFPEHGLPGDYRRWTVVGLASEVSRAGFRVVVHRSLGGTFAALALNLLLFVRYDLGSRGSGLKYALSAALPVLFVVQGIVNGLVAIAGSPSRVSDSFPIAVEVLARKDGRSRGCAG